MLFNTSEDESNKYFIKRERPIKTDPRNALGLKRIQTVIPELEPGWNYHFISDGAWSMDNIMEHLLQLIGGAATVHMFSWSFGVKAAAKIRRLYDQGLISKMYLLTHPMVKSGNFSVLQMLGDIQIAMTRIHAKGFIAMNDKWKIAVTSSSNYTDNQTLECGTISTNPELYFFYRSWLNEYFKVKK